MIQKWIIYAILGMLGTVIWNISLMLPDNIVRHSTELKIIYIFTIFCIAGIVSFIVLFYKLNKSKHLLQHMKKHYNYKYLILSVVSLLAYEICLIFAYIDGGGLVQVIINMNIILMAILGWLYFNGEMNREIIFGIILVLIGGGLVVHGKEISK